VIDLVADSSTSDSEMNDDVDDNEVTVVSNSLASGKYAAHSATHLDTRSPNPTAVSCFNLGSEEATSSSPRQEVRNIFARNLFSSSYP
jgi:hypothetical protein